MNKLKFKKSQLFTEVSQKYVDDLIKKGQRKYFNADDYIFSQGDSGDSMFIIAKGKVNVMFTKNSQQQTLTQLKAGDYFGEICLLAPYDRTASAIADEASELIEINADQVLKDIENKNADALRMIYNISIVLIARLRSTLEVSKKLRTPEKISELREFKEKLALEILF